MPGLSAISPVLQPLAASPLRESLRDVDRNVRSFAPEAVKELLTVVDQLEPLLLDVSNGRKEFQPTPEEAKELIKKYYSGPNTLLIKFRDDTIDETAVLAAVLTEVNSGGRSSSGSSSGSNESSSETGGRKTEWLISASKRNPAITSPRSGSRYRLKFSPSLSSIPPTSPSTRRRPFSIRSAFAKTIRVLSGFERFVRRRPGRPSYPAAAPPPPKTGARGKCKSWRIWTG